MDRAGWLLERRRAAEEDFDAHAEDYDREDEEMTSTHRRFVANLLERIPADGRVLDAACGTGKYFGMILGSGLKVVGADQSAGMLAAARTKYPDATTERIGLQELSFAGEFDGVICVDAMEFVSPEAWPLVIGNLRRALRPGGALYITVETKAPSVVEAGFTEANGRGLPVVPGEYVANDYYHYYPPIPQVLRWVDEAGLEVLEEAQTEGDGYGYHHLLAHAEGR